MDIGGVGAIEVTAVRTRGLDELLMYEDEVVKGLEINGGTNEDDGVYGRIRMLNVMT